MLAIDQGTTSSIALVIARDGQILSRSYSKFTQHYPEPGWMERLYRYINRPAIATKRLSVDDRGRVVYQ